VPRAQVQACSSVNRPVRPPVKPRWVWPPAWSTAQPWVDRVRVRNSRTRKGTCNVLEFPFSFQAPRSTGLFYRWLVVEPIKCLVVADLGWDTLVCGLGAISRDRFLDES